MIDHSYFNYNFNYNGYNGGGDCKKCCVHGYIYSCVGCRDYVGLCRAEHERKFIDDAEGSE